MIDSRDLNDLHPTVKALAEDFLYECKQQGLEVQIICTLRDEECQNYLYAKGRTVVGPNPTTKRPMGNKVTNARGGESYHNYGLAFDVLAKRNGKAVWGTKGDGIDQDPTDDMTDDLELWQRIGAAGKKVGLEWAGDWVSFKEFPHFQWTGGLTIKDLQAGRRP
jgi:peptidoglycan L-alanyl-D-glutamate endopeptidase CwlK